MDRYISNNLVSHHLAHSLKKSPFSHNLKRGQKSSQVVEKTVTLAATLHNTGMFWKSLFVKVISNHLKGVLCTKNYEIT